MREKRHEKADTEREIELLCNIAASELLLPGNHFIDGQNEYGFSLSSVVPLSERFKASKTAIIIKMVSSGKRVCVSA